MPLVNLATLKARVYSRVDSNRLLFTAPEVQAAINEAIQVVNLSTGFIQGTFQIPGWSQVNRIWYDTPAQILIPLRVTFEGQYLQPTTLWQLGASYPNWTADTTNSTGLQVSYWVPCGLTKFGIYPADSLGGCDLRMTGVLEPVPLVNDTDVLNLPNEYASAVDLLATHTLILKESSAAFAQGSKDYQKYLSVNKQMTIWKGLTQPRYFVPEAQQSRL